MAAAVGEEMQRDKHQAKDGTNRNKSGLRQERQKGSSLVTPQVFHSVTYGLHKDKEITRNIFVMLAHDRKHVIQKSKITVIPLPTPFLSLLPCSTFPVFQKGPQSGQSSCSRGRPARIWSHPGTAASPPRCSAKTERGEIALTRCLGGGAGRKHLPGERYWESLSSVL